MINIIFLHITRRFVFNCLFRFGYIAKQWSLIVYHCFYFIAMVIISISTNIMKAHPKSSIVRYNCDGNYFFQTFTECIIPRGHLYSKADIKKKINNCSFMKQNKNKIKIKIEIKIKSNKQTDRPIMIIRRMFFNFIFIIFFFMFSYIY